MTLEDFFAFYRSLKAYEGSFSSKNDVLILDQNSSFFDYFRSITGSHAVMSSKENTGKKS